MNLPEPPFDRDDLFRIIEMFTEEVRTSRQLLFSSFGAAVLIPTALANSRVLACLVPERLLIFAPYLLALVLLAISAVLLMSGEETFRRKMENFLASTNKESAVIHLTQAATAQVEMWTRLKYAKLTGMSSLALLMLSAAFALWILLSCPVKLP